MLESLSLSGFTSGTVSKGDQVFNSRTGRKERIGRLIQIQSNDHKDIETCYAGDIAAIVGPKNVRTGDTLHAGQIRHHVGAAGFSGSGYLHGG